ncbi:MAG: DUF2520 domain-containing protein [Tannerellaceae bacterium]|jgi:predicted short-subunit dehydrogenase-like oxidoreductase (DUF2520 family)|nr:DUF2520 domain-containing protein [Tannerellaceae bacterium]
MKIVFIGAGNFATCVSLEMQRAGMTVAQVYSRSQDSAESLAKKLNCQWTIQVDEILPDADLYIFSLQDTALPEVIDRMKPNDGMWVHTAGSVPMQIFEGHARRYGVFYPLQTFSKKKRVKLDQAPIFLEVNNPDDMKMLKKVAIALSGNVQELDSEKRKHLHLAAVFACNFTNHMYLLASKILEEQGISYDVLLPLITETTRKLFEISPDEAQTGPAVRFDKDIIEKQMAMLSDPGMQTIYRLISQNIYKEKLQHEQY